MVIEESGILVKDLLQTCRVELTTNLDTSSVIDHLIAGKVITSDEEEIISSKPTRAHRAKALVQILEKRGLEAYKIFLSALHCSSQLYLAKFLECQQPKLTEMISKLYYRR